MLIVVGIKSTPVLLKVKESNSVKLPTTFGNVVIDPLLFKFNFVNLERFPISVGKLFILLEEKFNSNNSVKSSISAGKGPFKFIPEKESFVILRTPFRSIASKPLVSIAFTVDVISVLA